MGRRRPDYGANDIRNVSNEIRDTSRQIRGLANEVDMDAARQDTALGRAIIQGFLEGRDIASLAPFRNALAASQAIQAREMRQQGLNSQRLATFGFNPYQVESTNAMRRLMAEEMGGRVFTESTAQSLPIVLSTAGNMMDRTNQALGLRAGFLGGSAQGLEGAVRGYQAFGAAREREDRARRSIWSSVLRAGILGAAGLATGGLTWAGLGAALGNIATGMRDNRSGGG